MIVIATRKIDSSTNDIIDWIDGKGGTVVRVDEDNTLQRLHIVSGKGANNSFIQVNQQKIYFKDIVAFWHRKGQSFFADHPAYSLQLDTNHVDISEELAQEWAIVKEYLFFLLSQKRNLGNYFKSSLNKLIVQHQAQAIGLTIPQAFVLTAKEDALNLDLEVITKALSEVAIISFDDATYCSYTTEVTQDFIQTLPENFFPALMQEKIVKKYELRVFYLDGKCYSMAIFSQLDQQTAVDFRVYNMTKPNRTVPYQLPQDLEEKIDKLMHELQLNTGSLDFMVTQDNEFYFLEVNPVGQFGMVSLPCNYYLEKKIADYLLNNQPENHA
ncbi:grasp-with-spasm system ATP-grasp peptide maturase [uncultured Microscilla sp.]|uniref:grasp-with-spasm system ATP-grasp peptide maturase n=1 Tax=uncultured Microscilla sp. TaxID=432653 RepID=UPI0026273531|nr:grasp-with-spasm system ATP-grasp peptide maturase [uncultured Microscilla sp.]